MTRRVKRRTKSPFILSAGRARAKSHEPIFITGKRTNAVLLTEVDRKAVRETLYLALIPRMQASIRKGLETPLKECTTELDW